jgi:hypothetical protein
MTVFDAGLGVERPTVAMLSQNGRCGDPCLHASASDAALLLRVRRAVTVVMCFARTGLRPGNRKRKIRGAAILEVLQVGDLCGICGSSVPKRLLRQVSQNARLWRR